MRLTSYRHRRDTRLIEHWSEYRKETSPAFSNACRQLYAAFRYQCPTSLAIPVSILCGDRDALVNMQSSKALAQHFKVELMVLAYCGHDITIDAPAKLVHYLFDILSSNHGKEELQLVDCADLLDLLDEEIAYHEAKLIQAIPRYSSALPAESE